MSSDFMFARLCPSPSVWPVRVRDHPPPRAGRRERQCGHHRRAQRNGGPAPRAGPSARSRDRPPPQEAQQRAAPLSAVYGRDCARLRRRRLWSLSVPRARPGTASFPVSSRRRDCSVKVSTDTRRPRDDPLKFGPLGQAAKRLAGAAGPAILMQGVKAPFRGVFTDTRTAGRRPKPKASRSGGELLAAARAARCKHLAAADRRRAGAKAVTTLAHELAGLIGPLHGSSLRIPIVGGKNRAPLDLKRANADSAATADATKRRAGKMNAALHAPLQGRAYAAPARASQSWLLRRESYCTRCCAVMAPRIEAVLHFALVVDVIESPVTKRDKDDDSDDGGDIAAPARMRLVVLLAGRGLAHAERLEARRSTSPSAAIALATMPFASSPAAAYMRSGLS